MIAKAFGRIGSSYQKLGDLSNAIKFYSKSLTEHRTPDVLTKLRAAEKEKSEADKKAYIDPEKAEIAREEGNAAFKVSYRDFSHHNQLVVSVINRLSASYVLKQTIGWSICRCRQKLYRSYQEEPNGSQGIQQPCRCLVSILCFQISVYPLLKLATCYFGWRTG